jgi:hypothetical protein
MADSERFEMDHVNLAPGDLVGTCFMDNAAIGSLLVQAKHPI